MIYFIKKRGVRNSNIKIGFTDDRMSKRMRELQNQSPDTLELIFAVPGEKPIEDMYHTMFAEYRLHGEWFRNGQKLKQFIKANSNLIYSCELHNNITFDDEKVCGKLIDELADRYSNENKRKDMVIEKLNEMLVDDARYHAELSSSLITILQAKSGLALDFRLLLGDSGKFDYAPDGYNKFEGSELVGLSDDELNKLPKWLVNIYYESDDRDKLPDWLMEEQNRIVFETCMYFYYISKGDIGIMRVVIFHPSDVNVISTGDRFEAIFNDCLGDKAEGDEQFFLVVSPDSEVMTYKLASLQGGHGTA